MKFSIEINNKKISLEDIINSVIINSKQILDSLKIAKDKEDFRSITFQEYIEQHIKDILEDVKYLGKFLDHLCFKCSKKLSCNVRYGINPPIIECSMFIKEV